MLALRSTGYKYSHISKQLNRDISAIRRFLLANTSEMGVLEIMPKEEKRGRKRKWNKLTRGELERLVDSMPQRCQAVIDARGLPTKY